MKIQNMSLSEIRKRAKTTYSLEAIKKEIMANIYDTSASGLADGEAIGREIVRAFRFLSWSCAALARDRDELLKLIDTMDTYWQESVSASPIVSKIVRDDKKDEQDNE